MSSPPKMSNKFTPILSSFGRIAGGMLAGFTAAVLFLPWVGGVVALVGSLLLVMALSVLIVLCAGVALWGFDNRGDSLAGVLRGMSPSEPEDDEPEISTREALCVDLVMQERVRCAGLAYEICESKGGSGRQLGTEIYSEIMKLGGE